MKDRLLGRLVPLNKVGQKKKTFTICDGCMRYRSTKKGFWMAKAGDGGEELGKEDWAKLADQFKDGKSRHCPGCWYANDC